MGSKLQQHVGSDFKVFRHMGVVVRRTQSTTLLIIRTRSPSDTISQEWSMGSLPDCMVGMTQIGLKPISEDLELKNTSAMDKL